MGHGNLPDRLISNNDLGPVLDLVGNSLKLLRYNLDGLSGLTLLQALTAAQNNTEPTINGSLGLAGDELVVLLENDPSLRVTEDNPSDTSILQLLDGKLACESAIRLVENILGCDLKTLAEGLARREEVDGWWGDDNLCCAMSVSDTLCHATTLGCADSTYRCWGRVSHC